MEWKCRNEKILCGEYLNKKPARRPNKWRQSCYTNRAFLSPLLFHFFAHRVVHSLYNKSTILDVFSLWKTKKRGCCIDKLFVDCRAATAYFYKEFFFLRRELNVKLHLFCTWLTTPWQDEASLDLPFFFLPGVWTTLYMMAHEKKT